MAPDNGQSDVSPGNGLPPLSLLDWPATPVLIDSPGSDVVADRIASQFRQRGIDATCVGVDGATRMTTFRFRLAEGGYDQITKADDLLCRMIAMATETSGVSIQAPILDSADIAVHVPRKNEAEPVRLAPFVEKARRMNCRVPLCLGEDYLGRPRVVDLATECHQLVAGQTGSGKSVFLGSAALTLAMAARPETVRLILVDGKGLDLTAFERLPHNACPVISEPAQSVKALGWLNHEMDRRRQLIRKDAAQDIWTLNKRLPKAAPAVPALVLMIDEFQAILSEPDADPLLQRLTQQGRACGIFVILATQRPSVDILHGSTKTNVPGRVCFRLPSQVDSRVVLDRGGAEQLAHPGDLLAIQGSIGRPIRLQAPLTSLDDIQRVRDFFDAARPHHIAGLVQAIDGGRMPHISVPTTSSPNRVVSPAQPEDRLIRPSCFLPVRVAEKTVLRKLKKEFPDREWSLELVYRPMLLAETDGKAHLLYDFESRSFVTHVAPWRAVEIGHLLDCTTEELQVLAAFRRMPRKLRSLAEIAAWLAEQGHPDTNLVDLVVRGLVSPNYRICRDWQNVPEFSGVLTTPHLPAESGTVFGVIAQSLATAIRDLRGTLALLWGISLGLTRIVDLPVWITDNAARMQLPAAIKWPWRADIQRLTISGTAVLWHKDATWLA